MSYHHSCLSDWKIQITFFSRSASGVLSLPPQFGRIRMFPEFGLWPLWNNFMKWKWNENEMKAILWTFIYKMYHKNTHYNYVILQRRRILNNFVRLLDKIYRKRYMHHFLLYLKSLFPKGDKSNGCLLSFLTSIDRLWNGSVWGYLILWKFNIIWSSRSIRLHVKLYLNERNPQVNPFQLLLEVKYDKRQPLDSAPFGNKLFI